MELRSLWKVHLQRFDRMPCHSLCFKPDYSQLIVASSNDLVFLDPASGRIIEQKRSHHAPVYCVRCSYDGSFFASADSEGTVVIWRSFNNEGFVTYGSQSAARHLIWCPTRQLLISTRAHEYNMWKPDDQRASRHKVKEQIQCAAFAPNGEVFVLSYASGVVHVISTEQQETLQTLNYSAIVTTLSFVTIDEVDYIVVADLDCKVSMFRASDKSLVGKNALPFEAMCTTPLKGASFFFAFAGIGGKVSLLSSGLSYLGDFDTDSKWIWDIAVDNMGRVAIATREGFAELMSIDFGLAFACSGDLVAYRTSINAMTYSNIVTKQSVNLVFTKILMSLAMSPKFLLVQFKDSIVIYRHGGQLTDENGNLRLERLYEVPGMSAFTLFAITNTHCFGANDTTLTAFDLSGHSICTFSFQSPITFLSGATSEKDGALVSCSDGCVYFVMLDQQEPVMLAQHANSVLYAHRIGLKVGILDDQRNAVIYDTFARKQLRVHEQVSSFAFSDRVNSLYATSDGTSISVYYKRFGPCRMFVEGTILGFIRNFIILSNEGSWETVEAVLPLEELIETENWDEIIELMDIGFTQEQWRLVAIAALKARNFELAKICAPHVDFELSFFVNEIAPTIDEKKWSIEVESFLGEVKHIELLDGDEDNGTNRANELEAAGVNEEALQLYASLGDWENVLRLAKERHLERHIVDYQFPPEVAEEAAKILLDAGLGDGAIRILTKTQNMNSLARAHMFLGQWPEAISLSRLYSSVYNIIYPRFGQLLFEAGQWFEALVCFFIPRDREERQKTLDTIFNVAADSCSCDRLSFVEFMLALNDPPSYWRLHSRALCYHAAHMLKKYTMMPLSQTDAEIVFYMSYYVMACVRSSSLKSINVKDILLLLLTASSILGLKRWVAYALKELSTFELDDPSKHIAQRAVRANKDLPASNEVSCPCPRCGKDFYSASRFPLLVCGFCGMRIGFSSFRCKALPLVPFEYRGENAMELIEHQPASDADTDIPQDVVTEDYLRETPAEFFVVQSLKDKSGVPMQYWYNSEQINVRTCRTCGSIFSEEDFEDSALDSECCPICRTPRITDSKDMRMEVHSDILELLRPFEEESPVSF